MKPFAVLVSALAGLLSLALLQAKSPPPRHGMVVAVSPPGADAGRDALLRGGNAVDAAVTTALAMAVTHPSAGNVGGGGFMVIHPAPGKGDPVVIDYREVAPKAAKKTMFTKDDTWYSHKAVGVPGTVAGLYLAHQKYGKLAWKDVVLPAVKLAEEGFALDEQLASSLNYIVSAAQVTPELRRVLGKNGGKDDWQAGDRWVQKDLAKTLKRIAEKGHDGFYQGETAELLAKEMKAGGGLITAGDLAAYRAKARPADPRHLPRPRRLRPAAALLRRDQPRPHAQHAGTSRPEEARPILRRDVHLMAETMRRAYCDRARHLGDQDFVKIPAHLTTKQYAKKLAAAIDPKKATRSEDIAKDIPLRGEGDSTTHFSVIDHDGMAVSNTYTLERSYGSRIVVRGAGFLLNNEMIDFNWFPGQTTRDGVIGTEANCIVPGKRMLSSQTPTVVSKGGKVCLITGSPGSRTIINTVLNIVVNVVDYGMDAQKAVDAPRLHHQWFPDQLGFEGTGDHREAVQRLEKMGHRVYGTRQGDAHTIVVDTKTGAYVGAADKRINGKASGF